MKDKKNISLIITIVIIFTIVFYNIFLVLISGHNENSALSVWGNKAYVITTESMKPTIKKGYLIIVRESKQGYEINDIITFKRNGEYITHRIVGKDDEQYRVKGDANDYEDEEPVFENEIEGKIVFKIPVIGIIVEKLDNVLYILILIIIVSTIIMHKKRRGRKSIIRRMKKEDADEAFREKEKTEIKETKKKN